MNLGLAEQGLIIRGQSMMATRKVMGNPAMSNDAMTPTVWGKGQQHRSIPFKILQGIHVAF